MGYAEIGKTYAKRDPMEPTITDYGPYYAVGEEPEWDRLCRERADASRQGPCTVKQDISDALDEIMGREFWEEQEEEI